MLPIKDIKKNKRGSLPLAMVNASPIKNQRIYYIMSAIASGNRLVENSGNEAFCLFLRE